MTAGGADHEMFRESPDEPTADIRCPRCDSVEWFPAAACFHCGWEGSAADAYEFVRNEVDRLRQACREVLANPVGHEHFDPQGTHGNNCEACVRDTDNRNRLRGALNRLFRYTGTHQREARDG